MKNPYGYLHYGFNWKQYREWKALAVFGPGPLLIQKGNTPFRPVSMVLVNSVGYHIW